MNDPQLLEWVLDDSVETSGGASPLAELTPPQALIDRTLNLVDAEWETEPRRGWHYAGVGLALAAGLLLAIELPSSVPHSTPIDAMTPKGLEVSAPEIGLKMAVSSQGQLARVEAGAHYHAGDTLYFRVSSSQTGWIYLVHGSENQAQLLTSQHVSPGETDLGNATSVLSWTIEAGDPASTFAVIGSLEAIDTDTLLSSLRAEPAGTSTAISSQTCTTARSMGWSCVLQEIEGSP